MNKKNIYALVTGIILFAVATLWLYLGFKDRSAVVWTGYIFIVISIVVLVVGYMVGSSVVKIRDRRGVNKINVLLVFYFIVTTIISYYFMTSGKTNLLPIIAIQTVFLLIVLMVAFVTLAAAKSTLAGELPKIDLENPMRNIEIRVRAIKNDDSNSMYKEELDLLYDRTIFVDQTVSDESDSDIVSKLDELELLLLSKEDDEINKIKPLIVSLTKLIKDREYNIMEKNNI